MTAVLRDWNKHRSGPGKQDAGDRLYKPLFRHLGFQAVAGTSASSEQARPPDYELRDTNGRTLTAVYAYPWDRWLDGPDSNDPDTSEENPAACVISALGSGGPDWLVVTNGKQWRLYSRHAHARPTNFYEVNLVEALAASDDTDPNEAFRYWWLFFRTDAFQPTGPVDAGCWLDAILQGSREFARKLGENLKTRIFYHVFKDLAAGFLVDRTGRLGRSGEPTRQDLDVVFEATLTLLYRLLFLLYAESRDLLPVREAAYSSRSLKQLKDEIAEKAGIARDAVQGRLERAYSSTETGLYRRLSELFTVMEEGKADLNVPAYNGGLFNTSPSGSDEREHRIARFLRDHRVPDSHLAVAIDSLARDQDERTLGLVPIDYKSLDVRHLGSIYEGLLEFKLILADEDKTTQIEKGREKYIPLAGPRGGAAGKPKSSCGKATSTSPTTRPNARHPARTTRPTRSSSTSSPRRLARCSTRNWTRWSASSATSGRPSSGEWANSQGRPVPQVRDGLISHRNWALGQAALKHPGLLDRFFDIRVVDPAMGSGHFLVETVDYITDRLLGLLGRFPNNPVSLALRRSRMTSSVPYLIKASQSIQRGSTPTAYSSATS